MMILLEEMLAPLLDDMFELQFLNVSRCFMIHESLRLSLSPCRLAERQANSVAACKHLKPNHTPHCTPEFVVNESLRGLGNGQ